MTVPAEVPSLVQSSVPLTPSLALKKALLKTIIPEGLPDAFTTGLMSLTSVVPASALSLRKSSRLVRETPVDAAK